MGKTPKKAAPGGDERNLYVRRLKATTASSRASESSFLLPERQRESENSNRPKLTGIQKKTPTGSGKNFKSKLRAPSKVGLNQSTKQLKLTMKNTAGRTTDMQPELEDAEVKLNVSIQKENITEEKCSKDKSLEVEELSADQERNVFEQMSHEPQTSTKSVQEVASAENEIIYQEKERLLSENIFNVTAKETEDQEDNDIKLTLEIEPNAKKDEEEKEDDIKRVETPVVFVVQDELKNGVPEKDEMQSEVQTDTESYSVEIVESTTSEISEISEPQNNTQKDKEKLDGILSNDPLISYDSSIILKDVKVKLNDCLKDNSNFFDVNDIQIDTPCHLSKEISYGKSLRNISGRHSISRMRHHSLQEKRISPNSSLFVNTSSMSIPQDEGTECKVLHYSSGGLSESFPTNGSSLDRKRKRDTQIWNITKKQKPEDETSLLNTSLNLLKGLRIPVQVSTPNITPYKFETKLDISGINDDNTKITTESTESTKKWCVIM